MAVDAIIVAFIGLFVWRGLRRGLLLSLTGLVGFVVATAAAVFGFRLVAAPLESLDLSPGVANLAGALLIFVGVTFGMYAAGRTLTRALRWSKLGLVNSAGGALLGGAWALSWVAAVLLAISVLPVPSALASGVEGSTIGSGIIHEAPRWARAVASSDLRRMLTLFIPRDREVAIVATADFRRSPDAERALFEMLNDERDAHGLTPLRWDEDIARAGRRHTAEMYRRGYFDHRGLDGSSPGDRMHAAGAAFRVAGENLVLAPTPSAAHARLMSSERHRRHILAGRFTRVGIAVMYGRQGLLIAQEFAG